MEDERGNEKIRSDGDFRMPPTFLVQLGEKPLLHHKAVKWGNTKPENSRIVVETP